MADEKKDKDTKETVTVPKPSFRERLPQILLWTFIVVNFLVMMGSIGLIYTVKIAYHRPTITEEKESRELAADREIRNSTPVRFTFEPFTVNLDEKPRKLVRATIQLEMLSETGYEEAVELAPVERDEIVRILNSKKYEDIETIQGKLFLKDQIQTAMNKLLHKGAVKEVYFGEFVVQ